jgi:hypothetical protein
LCDTDEVEEPEMLAHVREHLERKVVQKDCRRGMAERGVGIQE